MSLQTLESFVVSFVQSHPTLALAPVFWWALGVVFFLLSAKFAPKTQDEMQLLAQTSPRTYGLLLLASVFFANAQQLKRAIFCIATNQPPPPPEDPPTQKDAVKAPGPGPYSGMARIALAWGTAFVLWCGVALVVSGCAVGRAACSPVVLDAERVACGLILEGEHISAQDLQEARQKAALRRLSAMPAGSAK